MDHAILVAAGTGIEDESLSSHGMEVFGALPQIKRLVITAQRAGIKKFTIIAESGAHPLKEILNNDKRIVSEISWHPLGTSLNHDNGPSLILQSNLVTSPGALENFIDTETNDDEILVLVDLSDDAWIKTGKDGVSDLFWTGGRAVGAYIASGKLLEKAVMDSMSIKNLVHELVARDKVKYKKFEDSYWMRLTSDKGSVKEAEDLIFTTVGKTATGWISRNINSRFSLPTSRLLVKTPLTPNMISVMINIIGIFCGIFYAIGHPVIGALCMHAATILDRCDGEVARVKLMETKKGQWVDTISDQFTVLSFLIGVPVGYYFASNNPVALILGGVNVSIFVFFVIWSFYFLTRYTNSGSLVTYLEVDKLVEVKETSLIRKLIKIIRPMGRRNFYSLGFLVLAILGGYPWVLGFATVGAIMFFLHQLEDIIRLRKINPDNNALK